MTPSYEFSLSQNSCFGLEASSFTQALYPRWVLIHFSPTETRKAWRSPTASVCTAIYVEDLSGYRRLFVGEEDHGQDVVRMLKAYKKALSDEIKVFQLQRRVSGMEVAVGGFFKRKNFMCPIDVNFEHKNFSPAILGRPPAKWAPPLPEQIDFCQVQDFFAASTENSLECEKAEALHLLRSDCWRHG